MSRLISIALEMDRKKSIAIDWKPIPNSPQEMALHSKADELFFGGGAGGGKAGRCPDRALPSYNEDMETKVLTPKGFKLLGDIKINDQVCNPDGSVARVIQIQDHGQQQFYRVTLADGSSVEASEGHLWGVSISGKRKRAKETPPIVPEGLTSEEEWNLRYFQRFRVMDTLELKRRVDQAKAQSDAGIRPNWPMLPLSNAVRMTFPKGRGDRLPSYTLGVLIGDGCITGSVNSVTFTKPDIEIYQHVKNDLNGVAYIDRHEKEGKCPYHVIHSGIKGQRSAPIVEMLKRDGVYGCAANSKFIPARIKSGPIEERFAFIQGLFDTDGHMDDRGHVEFTSVSKQLAEDTQYVLRSLGYKATMTTKTPTYTHNGELREGQLAYRLYIQGIAKDRLFRLSRKKEHVSLFNGGDVAPSNRVVSVEKTSIDNARCITVDHPNSLYITDDFIVTHNSYLLMGLAFTQHERSIIYRREYPQLRELIEKSREIVGNNGSYNGQEHIWRLLDDRTVEFGAVQYEHSVSKFQGRAHDAKFFDEICHFTELQYRTLSGWARTSNSRQRVRVVATGNPPADYQGQWVREYWAPWLDPNHPHPASPGELVWYVQDSGKSIEVGRGDDRPLPVTIDGETQTPRSRTFIPARVDDNPYYMATGYKAVLQSMPEPLRSQLLYGDFAADGQDDPWQVFPSAWIDAAMARWTEEPPKEYGLSCLGGDPARGGADNSAIAERWGDWFDVHTIAGSETPDGPTFVQYLLSFLKGHPTINIDVIGVGSSPVDTLNQMGIDCNALSGADGSHATDRTGKLGFANKRSEWLWKFREALDPDYGSAIALPPNPRMKAGFLAMRWHLSGWKITIEKKDEIKRRLGYSPDEAEAIVYASVTDEAENSWFGFGSEKR